uniref:Uncharacterized protein n=1 Tax=Meloidogyne enterolobii TaxID=390850 RepID=A0A6V7VPQ2_MELEN|nr:unnamed protein product [Meloidogyne enterolobii]
MKMEGTTTTTHIHTSILYLALNRMDSLPEPSFYFIIFPKLTFCTVGEAKRPVVENGWMRALVNMGV